jgi:2-dehydro-3-deoxyphosphogalactonate aldolase
VTLDEAIAELPLIAILRGVRPHEVESIAESLLDAGIRGVEVPLNSPDPLDSIARLARAFAGRMACGAGTVLHAGEVDAVADAGGRIIVSPNTSAPVIARAVALGLDPAPGFATATEGFEAIAAGARHLKLFPAITYGPAHLRQLKAVLPSDVVVWAVGGVGPDAFNAWWSAGARAFGVGSDLYRPGQSPEETGRLAHRAVAALAEIAR